MNDMDLFASSHWRLIRPAPSAEDVTCSLYLSLTQREVLSIAES